MSDQLLYESSRSRIFLRKEDGKELQVVKVLNIEFPTPAEIRNFYNEHELSEYLPETGVRSCLGKTRENGRHALLFKYVKGENLKITFTGKQNDIADFLYVAIAACKHLGRIHRGGVIHGDISSYNILVDLQQRDVTFIDFSIGSRVEYRKTFQGNPENIQGNLAFISPEQTGRMNRSVDYRSDLYSLGVCFYEMLSGFSPFEHEDPLVSIHLHLAHIPEHLHLINPKVPRVISAIVQKLLQKNAEDRYQTAEGVASDLQKCLDELNENGEIGYFEPGLNDHSGIFLLPQKLYGREAEIHQLIENFGYCAKGQSALVLVSGYSGTGKSALVNEIHKPVTASRGYFISGKFDQFQRATPYYAIVNAFEQLIQVFLSLREDLAQNHADRIRSALGEEAQVVVNVLPSLEHLIGPQPEIPEVGGNESQSRFNYVFSKFVKALCSEEHPLVVFIDDVQWADSASLQLLEVLLSDKKISYFQCIFAYRDNEVSPSHPTMQVIQRIRESGLKCEDIHLYNLKKEDLNHLLSDATGLEDAETKGLSLLIYQKTSGNAFFSVKLLQSISENGLLFFDFDQKKWMWDLQAVRQLNVSDNVVEFLATEMEKLPHEAVNFLKFASCLGNAFSRKWVEQIGQISAEISEEAIFLALKAGLITELEDQEFKFNHDRIQQSAYSLIDPPQRAGVHYTIGSRLYHSAAPHELRDRIFEIADQLNQGKQLFTEDEKIEFAELNLQAGQEAKLNSAFQTAASYFEHGMSLLPENTWKTHYSLTLRLYSGACEAAYLNADFERMEQYFEAIERHAHNVLEKLKSYETRILALKAQNKLVEAVNTGLDILDQLGEPLPRNPNMLQVFGGLSALMWKLRNKHKDYFLSLPLMTNPEKIAAMRIIADITSSVYWATPNLLPLVVFKMMNISMKYGNNAVSCFAYGSYGVILCGVLGLMKRGNEFGEIALELLDKMDAKEWKAQIYVSPFALTLHWRNHVDVTLKPLQESFHIGLETGLIEFACVNTNIYCIHALLSGKELNRIEEETRSYSESYRQMKQETNLNYNEVYRQAMLNLLGKSVSPTVLTGEAFDEEKMLHQHMERNDKTGQFFIHFLKLMLSYYFRDFGAAAQQAPKARKLLEAVLAKFEIPNLHFYEALTAINSFEAGQCSRLSMMWTVYRDSRALKKWSKDAPMNFLHKYELICAEKYRLQGRNNRAALFYEKAIENASAQRFIHEEALARELAGRFYAKNERWDLASFYLKSAYNRYNEWGATAKLNQLKEEFSGTRIILDDESSAGLNKNQTTHSLQSKTLDFKTLIKSAASISSEVVLSKLLSVLLKNVIENAGAQRGILLIQEDGHLLIQALTDIHEHREEILMSISPVESNLLSESVLGFTRRTSDAVVVAEATKDPRFEHDPYVRHFNVQSVMCIPITHQAKFIGILYLENRHTKGAFTSDRVELISLLSSQIAVSIENALLYEQLEQKVSDRTEELRIEKQKSDELLYNILPFETAQELKKNGFAQPRFYDSATVLFTDFKGFTDISSKLEPHELVEELNLCFRAFDQIAEKYGIEKIKTIGDAYMAVGGIPVPNSVHPENALLAALEIRDFILYRLNHGEGLGFNLRIGIHTGPVVAGIVGVKKFQYDIWGDTVNIAARMESNSEAGRINISQKTYELVKDRFLCEEREEIEVKGKGKMKMYFVNGKK